MEIIFFCSKYCLALVLIQPVSRGSNKHKTNKYETRIEGNWFLVYSRLESDCHSCIIQYSFSHWTSKIASSLRLHWSKKHFLSISCISLAKHDGKIRTISKIQKNSKERCRTMLIGRLRRINLGARYSKVPPQGAVIRLLMLRVAWLLIHLRNCLDPLIDFFARRNLQESKRLLRASKQRSRRWKQKQTCCFDTTASSLAQSKSNPPSHHQLQEPGYMLRTLSIQSILTWKD